jgi:hypothetical protein
VPDNGLDSCQDPELHGTGLELRASRGDGEAEVGLARLAGVGVALGIQQRWRKHDKGL